MRISMVGLGLVGGNMTRRLLKKGHACVVFIQTAAYDIGELWQRGSVISSRLRDLTAPAFAKDPQLAGFEGRADFANHVLAAMRFGFGRHVEIPSGH